MNKISIDIKVNNKVIGRFIVNPDETMAYTANNSLPKTPITEQSNIDISTIDWHDVQKFVKENDIPLRETESGVLDTCVKWGTLTDSQKRVLPYVLKKAKEHGFKPSYPF